MTKREKRTSSKRSPERKFERESNGEKLGLIVEDERTL